MPKLGTRNSSRLGNGSEALPEEPVAQRAARGCVRGLPDWGKDPEAAKGGIRGNEVKAQGSFTLERSKGKSSNPKGGKAEKRVRGKAG